MKSALNLVIFSLMFILLSMSVSAHSASLSWTMNYPNYEVELYPCSDSACVNVGPRMISDVSSGNTYSMFYTAYGTEYQPTYHAAYFYKQGYRPIAYTLMSWGSEDYVWYASFSDSFEKKNGCQSAVSTLSVSDDNPIVGEAVSVSTSVGSAFTLSDDDPEAPYSSPQSHADYFTSDISASLDVFDINNNLVMSSPVKMLSIYQDGSAPVSFSLSTAGLSPGSYRIRLNTDPVDSICNQGNKIIRSSEYWIAVQALPNNPPVIGNIPDKVLSEDSGLNNNMLDLWQYATDETSDSGLTFTITSQTSTSVVECAIDSDRYIDCTTKLNQNGYSDITVQARDPQGRAGTDTFRVNVQPVNDAPITSAIPGRTVVECSQFSTFDLDDYVTDVDNTDAEITWTITGNSNLQTSVSQNHVTTITYTCGWAGTETLSFRAQDPQGESSVRTAAFTVVENTPTNEPPQISSIPDVYVFEDSGLNNNIIDLWNYASDAETPDSGLTFTITSETHTGIIDCTIDSNRYMDCTTQANKFGDSEITVKVEDPQGLTDTDAFTISVQPVNDAPLVSNIPGQIVTGCASFATFDLDSYVTDVDNALSEITWTVTGSTNLDVDIGASNVVTVAYTCRWTGTETLTFTAKDQAGLTGQDQAAFTVQAEHNTAPVIGSIPNKVLDENSGLNEKIIDLWDYASDSESSDSELDFTITSQTNNGLVTCSITSNRYVDCEVEDNEIGSSSITVKVEDPEGLSDTDTFTVTVEEQPEETYENNEEDNTVTIISITYDDKVKAGDYMHLNVYVVGDDAGVKTSIRIDELDVYETFSKLSGIYIQIPEGAESGKYSLQVSVRNEAGYQNIVYRDIEVLSNPVNTPNPTEVVESYEAPLFSGNIVISQQQQPGFYMQGLKGVAVGLLFMLAILVVLLFILRFKAKK